MNGPLRQINREPLQDGKGFFLLWLRDLLRKSTWVCFEFWTIRGNENLRNSTIHRFQQRPSANPQTSYLVTVREHKRAVQIYVRIPLLINPFITAHFGVFQFGAIWCGWGSNINESCEVNFRDNIILFFAIYTWIVEHNVQGSYNILC